ncbi:MAG: hypothetical protein DIKNOCCD_00257 [bacterium]|nr:hypothetical protein [bacterium]
MHLDPGIVAVVMIFSIPLVAIIGGLGLEALKVMKKSKGLDQQLTSEETATLQELHRLALQMEKRIEALETLIMDRSQQTESSWSEKLQREPWRNP